VNTSSWTWIPLSMPVFTLLSYPTPPYKSRVLARISGGYPPTYMQVLERGIPPTYAVVDTPPMNGTIHALSNQALALLLRH